MDMPAADAAQDDLALLGELNQGYIRAVATSDAAWFERHLAADFLNSNPDGSLSDRAAFIARIAQPPGVPDLGIEDVRIRLFGDTALIHARTVYTRPDGSRGAGRYTDIWVRQRASDQGASDQGGGTWRCVAAHVTRG